MDNPAGTWLSLDDVAAALKVGVPTVESLIERGLLQAEHRAGQKMVAQEAVLAFLRESQQSLEAGTQAGEPDRAVGQE